MTTRIVFAPNWIGDAVMALPAIADIRRQDGDGRLIVAARPGVADLMRVVPGIDGFVVLQGSAGFGTIRHHRLNVAALRDVRADVAVLLPNSAHAAVLAWRAGIAGRWGYRRDFRSPLLTRAVPKPGRGIHQVDAYRHLVSALGFANGPREPKLEAPAAAIAEARAALGAAGWSGARPLVGIAPGAAYGGAKRWPAERFARLIAGLTEQAGARCVLVGSAADSSVAAAVEAAIGSAGVVPPGARAINLVGRTGLPLLCGVLSLSAAFVSNDSGAMHLAAALGVPLVALFGPTDERATSPVGLKPAVLMTAPAWCRPCMLRECPLDHRCMTGIEPAAIVRAVKEWI